MRFDPKRHLIKVQGGRMYLPVSARLIWFRNEHPDWGIETEPVALDMERQYAIFRAKIYDAEGKLMATGTKREDVRGFPDYIEKAETGAVGRALALCGFGTQFAPELDEVDMRQAGAPGGINSGRFADSPQPVRSARPSPAEAPRNVNGFERNGRPSLPQQEIPATAKTTPLRPELAAGTKPATPRPESVAAVKPSTLATETNESPRPLEIPEVNAEETSPSPGAATETAETSATPACGHCGKALTRSQQELSIRHYGEALCPACQRDRARQAQPAAARS